MSKWKDVGKSVFIQIFIVICKTNEESVKPVPFHQFVIELDGVQSELNGRVLEITMRSARNEIIERMHTKEMLVRGIGICITVRIEWHRDLNNALRFDDAVELDHHFHYVIQMFQDIIGKYLVEMIIRKWIWKMVEVVKHIRIRTRIDIDTDSTGPFSFTAADI